MKKAIWKWGVGVLLGVLGVIGCGSGDDPQVAPRIDNRATNRASGTFTFFGIVQDLSLANSYAVAVQDPAAFSDQWILYVIFGMRSFNPEAVPQGVLAVSLDQVDPSTPTSIEVPTGRVKAALHTDFATNIPVSQQATAAHTVMNTATGGYFILEKEASRSPTPLLDLEIGLQVRLHNFTLSAGTGAGAMMEAEIPYRLTTIPSPAFLLYVQQLGVEPSSGSSPGDTGGGGSFPPPPPTGGGSSGGGGLPPPPPIS